MPKTIDDLVKCCMLDIMPPLPVIADYFGLNNIDNPNPNYHPINMQI